MNARTPSAPVAIVNPLAVSAMLARLTVTQSTFRKVDKAATDKVNTDNGATRDAGRYNKQLIASDALARITGTVGRARDFHYTRTLPWLDDGARILPAGAYQTYADGMHAFRQEFESEVESFIGSYPAFVEAARTRLGVMFNPAEYPAESTIRQRFTFGVRILPMPDAADFRVQISDAQAAAIRADIESSTREALTGAMRDAWNRIVEQVATMSSKLASYVPATDHTKAEGVFRNSLVTNVAELVELLPTFNLTADPFLTATIERMRRELCGRSAEVLRNDDAARAEVAASAESILADVSAFLA